MSDPWRDRLKDLSVIVTGAASPLGIGFASARRLAQEGARVLLTDLDETKVEARAADLRDQGLSAVACGQDVASPEGWPVIVARSVEEFGRLDGLVNNAGIAVLACVEDLSLADWRRQIDVNLTSVFLGCQTAFEQFRRQGEGGSIVNISSVAGLVGMRRTSAYAASKGGVRLMTKSLALEGGPDGIRVNSVHPGVIETEIQTENRRDASGDSSAIAASIPLRRTGEPDHIAAMVAFLISSDAAYITGAELVVDGGLTAQ